MTIRDQKDSDGTQNFAHLDLPQLQTLSGIPDGKHTELIIDEYIMTSRTDLRNSRHRYKLIAIRFESLVSAHFATQLKQHT